MSDSSQQEPLPPGWREFFTPEGKPYYYFALTNTTQWNRPVPPPIPTSLPPPLFEINTPKNIPTNNTTSTSNVHNNTNHFTNTSTSDVSQSTSNATSIAAGTVIQIPSAIPGNQAYTTTVIPSTFFSPLPTHSTPTVSPQTTLPTLTPKSLTHLPPINNFNPPPIIPSLIVPNPNILSVDTSNKNSIPLNSSTISNPNTTNVPPVPTLNVPTITPLPASHSIKANPPLKVEPIGSFQLKKINVETTLNTNLTNPTPTTTPSTTSHTTPTATATTSTPIQIENKTETKKESKIDNKNESKNESKSNKEYFKASPEILAEIANWEKIKTRYTEAITPILKRRSAQFDSMFSAYLEELREVVKSQGFDEKVQQKIVLEEFKRSEGVKQKIFGSKNAGIDVLSQEVSARRQTIELQNRITLLQSLVRRWLARKKFLKVGLADRTRTKLATEILETERAYVKSLEVILGVYLNPLKAFMKSGTPIMKEEDITKVFSNVEIIYGVQKELLTGLEERMKNYSRKTQLGDVFLHLAPYLKLYTQYVSNYNMAITTITSLRKHDTAVTHFFEDAKTDARVGNLDFGDFQIKPVQRVPRYELLLKEMVKNTDAAHPDYKNLVEALNKIQEVAAKINTSKRDSENLQKLIEIQAKLEGREKEDDLVQPWRNFVMEGALLRETGKSKPGLTLKKNNFEDCYIFLLTDILIVTHKRANILDGSSYHFHHILDIKLQKAIVEPFPDVDGFKLTTRGGVSLSFYANDTKERDSWVTNIRAQISTIKGNRGTLKIDDPTDIFANMGLSPTGTSPSVSPNSPSLSPLAPSSPNQMPRSNSNTNLNESNSNMSNSLSNLKGTNNSSSSRVLSLPEKLDPPKPARIKIKEVITLYEEVFKIESELFQVPIDLKTLFPPYYQQLPPQYQSMVWGRLLLLRQKVEAIDGLHDRILATIKGEKIALRLESVIVEGKTPIGGLSEFIKKTFRPGDPNAAQPRQLLTTVLKWYTDLWGAWEIILDEECE